MRISDWSSDVCSSDLEQKRGPAPGAAPQQNGQQQGERPARHAAAEPAHTLHEDDERIAILARAQGEQERQLGIKARREAPAYAETEQKRGAGDAHGDGNACAAGDRKSVVSAKSVSVRVNIG